MMHFMEHNGVGTVAAAVAATNAIECDLNSKTI